LILRRTPPPRPPRARLPRAGNGVPVFPDPGAYPRVRGKRRSPVRQHYCARPANHPGPSRLSRAIGVRTLLCRRRFRALSATPLGTPGRTRPALFCAALRPSHRPSSSPRSPVWCAAAELLRCGVVAALRSVAVFDSQGGTGGSEPMPRPRTCGSAGVPRCLGGGRTRPGYEKLLVAMKDGTISGLRIGESTGCTARCAIWSG
jgi:hypothetical protein